MANKNLPIKLFEKRKEVDERRVEGGGSGNEPKWVLSEDELQVRADAFALTIHSKIDSFQKRARGMEFIPATVSVELNMDALAKSHRSGIKQIFNVNYKSNIIGFDGENNVLVKIDNIHDIEAIERNIKNITRNKIGLSAITDIKDFEVKIQRNESDSLKVSIINFQDLEVNNAIKRAFEFFCIENKLEFKRTNYTPELIIYKIININEATIDSLKEFEGLESISSMPQYEIVLDFVEDDSTLSVRKRLKGMDYPVVGILDSGVARNKYTEPWLLDKKFTSYPEDLVDNTHGTFVSGVILYGDELEGKKISGLEGCLIFDATVMPDLSKEKIHEDELIENIREAIKQTPKVKIWNMSLGSKKECGLHSFSNFGQALDDIQKVYDVVICKSAGNCTSFMNGSGSPKSRISDSADSILSLVVGSIAHKKGANDDQSEINHPSPFTRIGKGPSGIVKPDLVSYGGNAHSISGTLIRNGVRSISPDGSMVSDIGTSFSTPRVSALLASLQLNIKEEFNPLLLKALAIHSAQYPSEIKMGANDKLKQMGFGLPSPAQDIIFNDEHEVTLILQDNLIKGEFMEILQFPYPDSLIDEDGYYYGNITLTVVTSPVLRNQGSEYCQSNLDVKFGTYDNIKERDTSKRTIINEVGPDGAKNILRDANYATKYRKDTDSPYANERLLINYGSKYNPIKKYSVNLSEMTQGNKESSLKAPKFWYLKVRGLYRDFAEEMAQIDGEELSQEFAIIITIRDNKREKQVYNEVTQLLDNRNFNHSNINLRTQVRVE